MNTLLSDVVVQRFWQRVGRTETCWQWTACTNRPGGYGQVTIGKRKHLAHRVAYELAVGPIPEGMFLDHRCFNRRCVRPDHLRLVTTKQNAEHRAGVQDDSATGVRGVSYRRRAGAKPFVVHVRHNGKRHHGGYFATLVEAECAALALRKQLFTHDDH